MAQAEEGPREHRGRGVLAQEIVTLGLAEGRHSLSETVARPTVVTLGTWRLPRNWFTSACTTTIPTGRPKCNGTLAGGDDLVVQAPEEEILCQHDTDPSQPTRVVEGHREGLGLAQYARMRGLGSRQTAGALCAGRVGYRWPARACHASSGRCARVLNACSKDPTASRCAERSRARCPARCQ